MCVIWNVDLKKVKNNNKKFFEIVKNAWQRNSDGAGVLWHTGRGCYINKFLTLKQLLKFLFKNINKFRVLTIHFRQATSGRVDLAHTHMWVVEAGAGAKYVVAVNGVVTQVEDWRALLGLEASIQNKAGFDSWLFVDALKKYGSVEKLNALAKLTHNRVYIYNVGNGKEYFLGDGWEATDWGRVSSQAWIFREYKGFWRWGDDNYDNDGAHWVLGYDGVWRLYDKDYYLIREKRGDEK